MKIMRLNIIMALLSYVTFLGCSETAHGPVQVANEFYTTVLQLNIRGLPTPNEANAINPFFSTELRSKFARAKRKQEKFIEEAKKQGETLKAPWSGGNLFGSNYEGMSSFSLGFPQTSHDTVSIPVYLEYRGDKNDRATAQWIDILVLKQTSKGWKVYDIFFCASWDFGFRGNLRSVMTSQ